ncbi:flagellar M-ring protein [Jannaschia pagri]|uniref:Flagellar M-ring protein n=1 Tax=Jannaschia pagri TaxID=2829797 RepID=A0ABQ4NMY0_9RHOB|nr:MULTISPECIES: flagellar basal-body MS-ring/collar protein FliF [unclassified Jannaschia]GIT91638.1 flagellar M-ring protein [Jannaschia sp. AI_61]GIT95472.1 flagellar M-ring protein [Jannaschia sp. AI_62]
MESFAAYWQAQDKRRLTVLAAATLVTFLSIFMLTRIATAPRMELLFARLDPAAAGEVVASLEARGVTHEVRGDAIYVSGEERDALRLQLAGEGLPRTDGAGYELLDGLSGFGTTSQMFDAAYWRAREGELTRTILAANGVKAARVHIATADASPFSREREASASVTIQMVAGAVGASLAQSVQSLVAGAVPNLAPEAVTVIDSASGRVVGGDLYGAEREARDNRVAEMRNAVENLLAARVGEGRYVVELAVETRSDREIITERVLDPESRVVISTDTEERTSSERGAAGAGVTVASNLPEGDAPGGDSEANNAETRERVNYDFSAIERQVERGPGSIERVTVAVMVDGLRTAAEDGAATWAPRPEEELSTIRELVQSAVGFREDRGDVVTVHSMEFELPAAPDAAPALSLPWLTGGQATQLGTAALLALVAIAALAFFVRPTLRGLLMPQALPAPSEGLAGATAPLVGDDRSDVPPAPQLALNGPDPATADAPGEAPAALPDLGDLSNLPDLGDGTFAEEDAPAEDPVERLRQLISERREETIEVLRGWMDETPEDAR